MSSANFIASNFLSQVPAGRMGIIQSLPHKGRLRLHKQVCALWAMFWHHNIIYVTTELSDLDVRRYFDSLYMSGPTENAGDNIHILNITQPEKANLIYELTRQASTMSPRPNVLFIDSLERFVTSERERSISQVALEVMHFGNLIYAPTIITAQESRHGDINTRLKHFADIVVDVEEFETNTMLGVSKNRFSGVHFDKVMV